MYLKSGVAFDVENTASPLITYVVLAEALNCITESLASVLSLVLAVLLVFISWVNPLPAGVVKDGAELAPLLVRTVPDPPRASSVITPDPSV
jgi:hypothetical protein